MDLIIPKSNQKHSQPTADSMSQFAMKRCLCGEMFEPYRPYQRFCNDDCRNLFWKTHSHYKKKEVITRMCKECGTPFETNDRKRKYCKDKCYELHESKRRKPQQKRICFYCGEEFLTSHWLKHYCCPEHRLAMKGQVKRMLDIHKSNPEYRNKHQDEVVK